VAADERCVFEADYDPEAITPSGYKGLALDQLPTGALTFRDLVPVDEAAKALRGDAGLLCRFRYIPALAERVDSVSKARIELDGLGADSGLI